LDDEGRTAVKQPVPDAPTLVIFAIVRPEDFAFDPRL
jgi:hypothetical protein